MYGGIRFPRPGDGRLHHLWVALALGLTGPAPILAQVTVEPPTAAEPEVPSEPGERPDSEPDDRPGSELAAAVASFDEAWRIVHETHFDSTFGGVDWRDVRRELRPRALEASDPDEVRALIHEMLGRLEASHFGLIPGGATRGRDRTRRDEAEPRGGPAPTRAGSGPTAGGGTGLSVLVLDGRAVVARVNPGSSAAAAGIEAGWILESIDGRAVPDPALPPGRARLRISARLRGPEGSSVEVVFRDGRDRKRPLELRREPRPGATVSFGNLGSVPAALRIDTLPLSGEAWAGYVHLESWMPQLVGRLHAALDRMHPADGIVIDLRGNGGGLAAMVIGVAGHFVEDSVLLGVQRSRDAELRFVAVPRRVSAAGRPSAPYSGSLAILVDELTGSASEVFAAGLQASGRGRVFGRPTAGIVLPATLDPLPNGDALLHAVADFRTADGARLEERGVRPDVEVVPTREELLRGRDPTLEAALRWIVARPGAPERSSATARGRPANEPPSADAVIARYVGAVGGRNALLSQPGRHARGTVQLPGMGIRGEIETWTAPDRYRTRSHIPEMGAAEVGWDGSVGWSTSALLGPSLLSGRALEQVQESARLTTPLHEGAEIEALELRGSVEFEGRPTWRLAVTTAGGETYTEYFDRETGLLLGLEREIASPMGNVPTVVVLEEYRPVGGVLVPRVRRERMMGIEQVTRLTSVEARTIPEEAFEPPVAIRALQAGPAEGVVGGRDPGTNGGRR